jgi:hypothetical protein
LVVEAVVEAIVDLIQEVDLALLEEAVQQIRSRAVEAVVIQDYF